MRRVSSGSKGSSMRVASRSASRTKASGSAPAATSSSMPAASAEVARINKGIAAVKKKFFKPR